MLSFLKRGLFLILKFRLVASPNLGVSKPARSKQGHANPRLILAGNFWTFGGPFGAQMGGCQRVEFLWHIVIMNCLKHFLKAKPS